MSERFPKSHRLRKAADFDRVFARRRSQSDGILVLYGCPNELDHSRLGLVVSKKAGNAVQRAHWKRCLREAFRQSHDELPPRMDFIALPRAGISPTTQIVRESMLQLAERLERARN